MGGSGNGRAWGRSEKGARLIPLELGPQASIPSLPLGLQTWMEFESRVLTTYWKGY